jgi:hypothetical protein
MFAWEIATQPQAERLHQGFARQCDHRMVAVRLMIFLRPMTYCWVLARLFTPVASIEKNHLARVEATQVKNASVLLTKKIGQVFVDGKRW